MGTQGQSRIAPTNSSSLGAKPQIAGCRGIIPLPGRGAEPHIVPTVCQWSGTADFLACILSFYAAQSIDNVAHRDYNRCAFWEVWSLKKTISMSIRVSEDELETLKQAIRALLPFGA